MENPELGRITTDEKVWRDIERLTSRLYQERSFPGLQNSLKNKLLKYLETARQGYQVRLRGLEMTRDQLQKAKSFTREDEARYAQEEQIIKENIDKLESYKVELELAMNRMNKGGGGSERVKVTLDNKGNPLTIEAASAEEAKKLITELKGFKDTAAADTSTPDPSPDAAAVKREKIQTIAQKYADAEEGEDALTAEEKEFLHSHVDEISRKVDAIRGEKMDVRTMRKEIALAILDETPLTTRQQLQLLKEGEEKKIEAEKTKIENLRLEQGRIADILSRDTKLSVPADDKFYKENRDAIDALVAKKKEKKLENDKKALVEKIAIGEALTAEEQALEAAHKAEINEAVVKKLQEKIAATTSILDREKYQARIRERMGTTERARAGYKRYAEDLAANLSSIEDLKKGRNISDLDDTERARLAILEEENNQIYEKLDKLGPSGRHFATLEVERANLAKTSLEFQKTFKSKFFGAKAVGVLAGMFGSKWSAVKESDKTPEAKKKMDAARHAYDQVRQKLMNTLVNEEHGIRKTLGETAESMAGDYQLKSFLRGIHKELVEDERRKLDDMKHVFESTVRGSAMRRFGEWNAKGGWFKDIKNQTTRRILHRVSMALVLGAPLSIAGGAVIAGVAGVGASAVTGSLVAFRLTRAVVSGAIGESAAIAARRIHGGTVNEKGELSRHLAKKDAELHATREAFVQKMAQEFANEEKPMVTSGLMDKLNKEHEAAVNNYMRRQGNTRRAEMWARLIVGGGASVGSGWAAQHFGLIELPSSGANADTDHHKGGIPITETPQQGPGFGLEGTSVPASPQGAIQSFMDLKKEMLLKYSNPEKYPMFQNLSDDEKVAKLLATGKFDDLSADILKANSLQEFMQVAKEHGFWRPEGWGNPNIDSASVPFGSTLGIRTNAAGNMEFFIELPDGRSMSLNDFSQMDEKFTEAKMINTDGGRISRPVAGSGNEFEDLEPMDPGRTGTNEFEDLEQPDPGRVTLDETLRPDQTSKTPEVVFKETAYTPSANPTDAEWTRLESDFQRKWLQYHGDYFQKNKLDLSSPYAIYRTFLSASGHTVSVKYDGFTPIADPSGRMSEPQWIQHNMAKGHITALVIDGREYKLSTYPNVRADDLILERDLIIGSDNGIPVTMQHYYEYLKLDHYNMVEAPYAKWYSEQVSYALENRIPNPELGITQELLDNANKRYETWLDKIFGKNNIFGRHTDGADTRAWRRLSDDDAYEFMNDKDNMPPHGRRVSDNEELYDTLDKAIKTARKNGIDMRPVRGETMEQFVRRLAFVDSQI